MSEGVFQQIFEDSDLIIKIKNKLPQLFLLAEHDNSRNGKLGMEIGSARERVLIAMLMYKFGEENVNVELPITSPEVDVMVHTKPLSIKTISGSRIGGVKLIWTVDTQKALEFTNNYRPSCDLLLAHINWGGVGHMFLFTKEAQQNVLSRVGKENYMKLPKAGTNPRGVELSRQAIQDLIEDRSTKKIDINFTRQNIDYNPYHRWLDHWHQD